MDEEKNKEVLKFFMEDSPWPDPKKAKRTEEKIVQETQTIEIKKEKENLINQEKITDVQLITKDTFDKNKTVEIDDTGFGEIDYALLKSITYGFKTIPEIAKSLQIRNLVVEKHIYKLIKEGFIKYFQFCVITAMGKKALEDFETNNSEDIWKPIDEFIRRGIENNKERKIKIQKAIDIVLAASLVILIILIIYFGIF